MSEDIELSVERWQQAKQVFIDAIQLSPEQREEFLLGACEGNDQFRADVESLLAFHEQAEEAGFLAKPVAGSGMKDALAQMAAGLPSGSDENEGAQAGTISLGSSGTVANGLPEWIGKYRVLGLIGMGGMGRVYKALDPGLDRIVAIKTIRSAHLSGEEEIARFQVEAKAAGSIKHPNIVPVYEVGQTDDGTHYYAMAYIEGQSLAERISDEDDVIGYRKAAETIRKIAEAIQFAHDHNIIHRDLKPGNVLLGKDGEPHIVDFGLAKQIEYDSGLTLEGSVIGTPSYMAPEQAKGQHASIGKATDVYGLGAVLYALIAGRPPFQAPHVHETIRQVIDEEVVPPRVLNRDIPRDLETICLACLEKEPDERYESAQELADELKRFLSKEVIHARPVSRAERFWRWCKRNPVVASLSAAVLVLALVAIVILAESNRRLGKSLAAEKQALQEKTLAQQRDEASFRAAVKTVDELLTRVSEEKLFNLPGLQPVRRDLLVSARNHYKKFLADRGSEPGLRDLLARAHFRVGQIEDLLGNPDVATKELREAERIQREVVGNEIETAPADQLLALSNTLTFLARINFRIGKTDLAVSAIEEAVELREASVRRQPDDVESQRKLASSLMNAGVMVKAAGEFGKARSLIQQAQETRRELLAEFDEPDFALLRDLGMGYYNLGLLEPDAPVSEVIHNLGNARKSFSSAAKIRPQDSQVRSLLLLCSRVEADTLANVASASREKADYDAAATRYNEIRTNLEALASENPDVPEYQAAVARLNLNQGGLEAELNNDQAALDLIHAAVLKLKTVYEKTGLPDVQRDYAVAMRELAVVMHNRDASPEQVCRLLITSRDLLTNLDTQNGPSIEAVRRELDLTRKKLAELECPEASRQTP